MHTESGKEHEEEGLAKTKCYELATNTIPHSRSTLTAQVSRKEKLEEVGIKEWNLGKRRGRVNFFRFVFTLYYSTLFLFANKAN